MRLMITTTRKTEKKIGRIMLTRLFFLTSFAFILEWALFSLVFFRYDRFSFVLFGCGCWLGYCLFNLYRNSKK